MSVYRHAHLKQTVRLKLSFVTMNGKAHCRGGFKELTSLPKTSGCPLSFPAHAQTWLQERSVSLLFTNLAVQFICTKLQTVNNVLVASSLSTVSQPPINTRKTRSKQGVVTLTNTVCVYNDDPIYPKYRCGLRQ